MVGWHHCLNGHDFEQTPGDSEGQGSLACCSPWGHKESDMASRLNNSPQLTLSEIDYCWVNFIQSVEVLKNKTAVSWRRGNSILRLKL